MKREIGNSEIIVGDLDTLLSVLDRTTGQKIGEHIEDLNNDINQLYLTDFYRIVYSKIEFIVFFRRVVYSPR